jgi:hypothetical protein
MIRGLEGKRFGRLLVVERMPPIKGARNAFWRCLCDCGNEAVVAAANFKTTVSCGCHRDTIRITHDMSHTPEHNAWVAIKQRCYNPNGKKFHIYGARGIEVCERWLDDFANFYADMGPRPSPKHSIDRFPNKDGNYEPGNCRWATGTEQARNRNVTKTVEIDGVHVPIQEWCEKMDIKRNRIREMARARGGREKRFESEADAVKWLHEKITTQTL